MCLFNVYLLSALCKVLRLSHFSVAGSGSFMFVEEVSYHLLWLPWHTWWLRSLGANVPGFWSSSCYRSWGGHWHSSWLLWLATWEAPWRRGLLGNCPLALLNSIKLRPSLFILWQNLQVMWLLLFILCTSSPLLPQHRPAFGQLSVTLPCLWDLLSETLDTDINRQPPFVYALVVACSALSWTHGGCACLPQCMAPRQRSGKVQAFCMRFSSFSWPVPAITRLMLVELKWIQSSASLSESVKKFPCVIGPLWLTLAFISAFSSWRIPCWLPQNGKWDGMVQCDSASLVNLGWKAYKWNHLTNFDINSMEIELRRDKVSWGQGKGFSFHLVYL